MRKRIIRAVIASLIVVLLTTVMVEAALWFIDPLGIATYVYDLSTMVTIASAEGYTLPPGVHTLRHWSYTIDEFGNRIMPRSESACIIAFVGDSVTFGQGVNDDETFAYKIALENPGVRFINLGKIAYNIANVRRAVESNPANGYLYFISDNDDGLPWERPPQEWGQPRELPPRLSAVRYYVAAFQERSSASVTDLDAFWRDLEALRARGDVLMFAMGSPLGAQVIERYPDIAPIPHWGRAMSISWIDGHPNAAGHVYLLNALRERVTDFVTKRCGV
ncbi:MAG: hypothetical protein CUN53_07675 [Phototrophicales bacterium]|nr:MAG: hypothetical protein CUN53_07675 [Phototrophicales bacterium]